MTCVASEVKLYLAVSSPSFSLPFAATALASSSSFPTPAVPGPSAPRLDLSAVPTNCCTICADQRLDVDRLTGSPAVYHV